MSDYKSEYYLKCVQKIRAEQDRGGFVLSTAGDRQWPVPNVNDLPDLRSAASWTGDRYEAANGSRYRYSTELSMYVLSHGQVPDELAGWPKAQAVEAIVRAGEVQIIGVEVTIDMDTSETNDYTLIKKINERLCQAGLFVWAYTREADTQNPISTIANESASVHASSLVWCHQDQALVAAVMVDTSTQTLQAIRATLASNRSRSLVTVKSPGGSAYASSIKRGYAAISASLVKANAVGMVQVIMHPLCGNPQEETGDHFYVVATPGENLAQKAGERLALAIPWPTNPEWTDYLLAEGKTASLVENLPVIGPDFTSAVRIEKSQEGWQIIIAEGLRYGKIKI